MEKPSFKLMILRRKKWEGKSNPSRERSHIPKALRPLGKMSFLSHWYVSSLQGNLLLNIFQNLPGMGNFLMGLLGPPKGFHYTRNSWQVTGMYQGISHNKPGRLINQPPNVPETAFLMIRACETSGFP